MKIQLNKIVFFLGALLLASTPVMAASEGAHLELMGRWEGIAALVVFVVAYALVIGEETIHLRKSKPVMVAAGFIWILVSLTYSRIGETELIQEMVRHGLLEFVELFLFLLAAMTYINTMDERGVFDVLRSWLLAQRYSLRKLFWVTGAIAFVMSPIADNLTTALLLSTVVIAVAGQNLRFAVISCINVVVAANAGGAFSPFGDITTLMVWQAGLVEFTQFFALIIPSLVNWLVTASLLSLALSSDQPEAVAEDAKLRHGAWVVMALFILTISMAVITHTLLHLPPVIGMMTGLGLLKLFGYYLQRRGGRFSLSDEPVLNEDALSLEGDPREIPATSDAQYDIYRNLQQVEWDTLLFFYGIMLCVAGLGAFGYLAAGSDFLYGVLGPTTANILVTAGVGGSMLAVGSAAGVAVMGQARGIYTFFSHLKWSWAVVIGYAASVWTHLLVNSAAF
jgi:Na+/H+ antiporter NhaD/arsenite permease-like protein